MSAVFNTGGENRGGAILQSPCLTGARPQEERKKGEKSREEEGRMEDGGGKRAGTP